MPRAAWGTSRGHYGRRSIPIRLCDPAASNRGPSERTRADRVETRSSRLQCERVEVVSSAWKQTANLNSRLRNRHCSDGSFICLGPMALSSALIHCEPKSLDQFGHDRANTSVSAIGDRIPQIRIASRYGRKRKTVLGAGRRRVRNRGRLQRSATERTRKGGCVHRFDERDRRSQHRRGSNQDSANDGQRVGRTATRARGRVRFGFRCRVVHRARLPITVGTRALLTD
jgi:hypothetical protein